VPISFFATRCAKKIVEAGGSLRDVQELAGHASLATTQRYIQGDSAAKRKVVDGLRWALLGPFVNLHLSGGAGGISHVLEHLGPSFITPIGTLLKKENTLATAGPQWSLADARGPTRKLHPVRALFLGEYQSRHLLTAISQHRLEADLSRKQLAQ
jgi:hypothetical protein